MSNKQVHVFRLHLMTLALYANDVGGVLLDFGRTDQDVNALTDRFHVDLLENHSRGREFEQTAVLLTFLEKHPENAIKAAPVFSKFPFLMNYVLITATYIAEKKYKIIDSAGRLADVTTRDLALATKLGEDIQPRAKELLQWYFDQVSPEVAANRIVANNPTALILS